MTRLTIFWMSVLASALTGTVCWYVIKGDPKVDILVAVGGILATVLVKTAVAIINRNPAEPEK